MLGCAITSYAVTLQLASKVIYSWDIFPNCIISTENVISCGYFLPLGIDNTGGLSNRHAPDIETPAIFLIPLCCVGGLVTGDPWVSKTIIAVVEVCVVYSGISHVKSVLNHLITSIYYVKDFVS